MVPAIARPLTMVAMIGVATSAAPGNAVFDRPTIKPAMHPRIRLPAVNTGAAYVRRFAMFPCRALAENVRLGQVRACGLRRYTPCVL